MPAFSAFAPGGLLSFSSKPFHARAIYNALRADVGEAFAEGGAADAALFARAHALGIVQYTRDRAENQVDPLTSNELLPTHESLTGTVPAPRATLGERRTIVDAALKACAGNTTSNIQNALLAALGADFVALRATPYSESYAFPTNPATAGVFLKPAAPRRLYKLGAPVSAGLGSPQFLTYRNLDGSFPTKRIKVGDRLAIADANSERVEAVTVTDETSTGPAFRATATLPHDAGTLLVVSPWPYWISDKRACLVMLTPSAALDPEKRRTVDRTMEKFAASVSTWSIAATTSGTAGPFMLDQSPLDVTPLGSVSAL